MEAELCQDNLALLFLPGAVISWAPVTAVPRAPGSQAPPWSQPTPWWSVQEWLHEVGLSRRPGGPLGLRVPDLQSLESRMPKVTVLSSRS